MSLDKKLNSNIWKMYAYAFFHHLIFAYVIERLFNASRGITIQQVVYLEILYGITVAALEVPTGALADKWNRKNMMIISAVLTFFEFFILALSYNFWGFAFATVCAAVGGSMASGTRNALIYDSLKELKKTEDFEKILGRIVFFDRAASAAAAIIGGFTAVGLGLVSNYWLSLISVTISVVIAISFREPGLRTQEDRKEYTHYIKEAFTFLRDHRSIRIVLLYGIVIASIVIYLDEFWQIYLNELHIRTVYFGFFSSALSGVVSVSAVVAYKLKGHMNYNVLFAALVFLFSIFISFTGSTMSIAGVGTLAAAYFIAGLSEPLVMGYLHNKADSEYRATVESFQSLVFRVLSAIIGLGFGIIATRLSIFKGYTFLGLIALVYGIYFSASLLLGSKIEV